MNSALFKQFFHQQLLLFLLPPSAFSSPLPQNVSSSDSPSSSPLFSPSSLQIPVNSSSLSPLLTTGPSSLPISAVSGATISVECREPLMGAGGVRWECGVEENNELGIAKAAEEWWEEWEGAESVEGGRWSASASREGRARGTQRFHAGPLELYYSHKVNQSDGNLFISALLRWQFHSAFRRPAYRIHLRIEQIENGTKTSPDSNKVRHFVIPLAIGDISTTSLSFGKSSGSGRRSAFTTSGLSSAERNNEQRAELLLRIDGLFQFGRNYELKILCTSDNNVAPSSSLSLNSSEKVGAEFALLRKARKRIAFADLFDELDTGGCPGEDGFPRKTESKTKLARRKAMASRWTGALRSVSFFPLHSSINVSFFAAAPSHCISAYLVQLWLLNALQEERIVEAGQLVRFDRNVYIGSAEFRDLLKDERIKYRIKVLPVEQSNGTCVCELDRKCGCVQIYSDPFTLLNASSNSLFDIASDPSLPSVPPFLLSIDAPSPYASSSVLPLLLAGLFLALTLILLSIAILILIVRNSERAGRTKRRTLMLFGGKRNRDESGSTKIIGLGSTKFGSIAGGSRKEVQSVLLINAQPNRRNDLERFARVLVKNGVRVFYDRWDRTRLELNMIRWVQEAIEKSQKTVLFYDRRAEQLLAPSIESKKQQSQQRDLFDQVFCALYQHLLPKKTIFVKWDESKLVDGRPLGSLLLSENVFLFQRDLKHIFAALQVQATDSDLKDIEREYGKNAANSSLTVVVKARQQKAKAEELKRLLTDDSEDNENAKSVEGSASSEKSENPTETTKGEKTTEENRKSNLMKIVKEETQEGKEEDEGVGTTTTTGSGSTSDYVVQGNVERIKQQIEGETAKVEEASDDSGMVLSNQ